jgi:3'-phosphoadenosine 5'-phosphosulfate sulfotransferase (PAPS reductase)/FAD synthetase
VGDFHRRSTGNARQTLKRGPIERLIRSLGYKVVIHCMGIRAEESRSRAQLQPWSANNSQTTRTRQAFNWLPIFGESLRDVLEWHWNSAIPLHPVYIPEFHCDGTSGGYLRRFSCRVFIFSTDHDHTTMLNLLDVDPRYDNYFWIKRGIPLGELTAEQFTYLWWATINRRCARSSKPLKISGESPALDNLFYRNMLS